MQSVTIETEGRPVRVLHEMHHGQNRRRLKSRRLGKNREFLSNIGGICKKEGE